MSTTIDQERVRVLIILGSIPLFGLELANIEVGRVLAAQGHDVLFLTNEHWAHQAIDPRLRALGLRSEHAIFFGKIERGLTLKRLLALLRLQWTENWKVWRLLRKFRPHYVHVGSLDDLIAFLPSLMVSRARLVFNAGTEPDARHPWLRWLWRHVVFRRLHRLVAVSRYVESRFVALGAPQARTCVIYNDVPLRPSCVGGAAALPVASAPRFIYVGQLGAHKGVDALIEASIRVFSRRREGELVLLGQGIAEFVDAQHALVAAAGLEQRVRFVGYIADPSPWFASSHVHLCPSRVGEAFGIVVAEAKHHGRPSIVFANGALPELVAHEVDGYICAASTSAELERAMSAYLDDPTRAGREGEAARCSLERLGLGSAARRWCELYRA